MYSPEAVSGAGAPTHIITEAEMTFDATWRKKKETPMLNKHD